MYQKDRITESFYDYECTRIEKELSAIESDVPNERDYSHLEALQGVDWINLYNQLNRANKRAFWRTYIDYVTVYTSDKVSISFK